VEIRFEAEIFFEAEIRFEAETRYEAEIRFAVPDEAEIRFVWFRFFRIRFVLQEEAEIRFVLASHNLTGWRSSCFGRWPCPFGEFLSASLRYVDWHAYYSKPTVK
jgi:hypothetical protein